MMSNLDPTTAMKSEFQQAQRHIHWLQNWYYSLHDEKHRAAFDREIRRYKRLKRLAERASAMSPEEFDAILVDLNRARKAVQDSPDKDTVQHLLHLVTAVSWDEETKN